MAPSRIPAWLQRDRISSGDHVDLLVGEHSAGALGKGRHRGSPHAVGDDFAHRRVVRNGQIDRIGERDGRASPSVLRRGNPRSSPRTGRRIPGPHSAPGSPNRCAAGRAASRNRRAAPPRERRMHRVPECVHGRSSPFPRGGIIPGASTPARNANGYVLARRHTRLPHHHESRDDAESHLRCHEPDPVDMALQQGIQKAIASSTSSPDHSTGPIRPPSRMGRRANIGSIAPYSSPTAVDTSSVQEQCNREAVRVKRIQLLADQVSAIAHRPTRRAD